MRLKGALLRDITRSPVGRVEDVLLHPDTKDAHWLQVRVEADGATILVPAASVSEFAPGELLAPYPADVLRAARHAPGRVLTESEAHSLRRHYGFDS